MFDERVEEKIQKGAHSVIIKGLNENDFGEYKCVGKNEIGEGEDVVKVNGIPNTPKIEKKEVKKHGPRGTELIWKVESLLPINTYHVEYKVEVKICTIFICDIYLVSLSIQAYIFNNQY